MTDPCFILDGKPIPFNDGETVFTAARRAGVTAAFLGSHALRHAHASRQVDLGVPLKVLSDILGHQRPTTTSIYVRVATKRLREIALPVPSVPS